MYNLVDSNKSISGNVLINSLNKQVTNSPGNRIDGQEERAAQNFSLPQIWRVVLVHLKVLFGRDPRGHPARQGPLLVDGHLSSLE